MSGFNNLNRPFQVIHYPSSEQSKYQHLRQATEDYGLDTVFIADDSEWDSSKSINMDVTYRKQADIISHQYVIKYGHYPVEGIVMYRNPDDPPFSFWDLLCVVRYYLHDVDYQADYDDKDYRRLARQLGVKKTKVKSQLRDSYRVPPITWVGFFGGVDLTAYCDWQKYLDVQSKSKQTPNFISLNKQEFFSNDYSAILTNPTSRRIRYPVTLKFVDAMALGPQGGLAALGGIAGQAKLNTKSWDLQDDLITYRQYASQHDGGYYKTHMRYLLEQRPADYQRYALGDSEVTLKYLDFLMGNVIDVYNEGLINQVHIPATLTSLADEISSHFSHLPYDQRTVVDIFNDIFKNIDVRQFLRPLAYHQQPPKDQQTWQQVFHDIYTGLYNIPLFIKQLKPYLARGSVIEEVDTHGRVQQGLSSMQNLSDLIDYQQLYHDNPSFQIDQLLEQKVNVNPPRFTISSLLRNQYADHAHQFYYTKNNIPPTVDDVLVKLNNASVYQIIIRSGKPITWSPIVCLSQQLDFDKMRKGYDFEERSASDHKHKKGSHDQFSVRPDSVYNDGFVMAKHAYVGGMNLAFNPGVIDDAYHYKYDIDLKSSYVNAGHLIPDFRLDVKPIVDTHDLDSQLLHHYRSHPELFPNGPFTLGVATISYHFPDDVKRVSVGYKPPIKGQGPVYVRQANRVYMTLTDTINLMEHGADVRVHRIIIPQQKVLNGSANRLAPIGRMQHWSLQHRNKAKTKRDQFDVHSDNYLKFDSLQLFYKLLGNGGYGKSSQGLGDGGTRDFLTGMTMYVPFSRNTNPFTAAQYTSIARYQVNCLMDLVEQQYPDSLIPSVTTDGFIFCTNNDFESSTLRQLCENVFDKRWVAVNHLNFNDQYFELKSHNHGQVVSIKPLFNVRTRFNMTTDGHIKALVGLQPGEWTISRLIDLLKRDVVTFRVDDFRMQSLNDMKHSMDNKRYVSLKTWRQPKYLNLNPDDTYQPVGFVPQGEFGYYLTQPFSTIDELLAYRQELKPYRSLFPSFRRQMGQEFIHLDQTVRTYRYSSRREQHVAWVHDDVSLHGNDFSRLKKDYHNHYIAQVTLRYLGHHVDEYDLKNIYQDLFSHMYKRYSSFKQAVKRSRNSFVNPLCMIKEHVKNNLTKYHV